MPKKGILKYEDLVYGHQEFEKKTFNDDVFFFIILLKKKKLDFDERQWIFFSRIYECC